MDPSELATAGALSNVADEDRAALGEIMRRPGDIFGETGILALEPRNASVIATTPVQVAVAMGWDVRGLLPGRPSLKAALEAEAEQRDFTD